MKYVYTYFLYLLMKLSEADRSYLSTVHISMENRVAAKV